MPSHVHAVQQSLIPIYSETLLPPLESEELTRLEIQGKEDGAVWVKIGNHEQDVEKRVQMYRKGAELRNAEACHRLGIACLLGKGVPQNEQEGLEWHRKAADKNLGAACKTLGDVYKWGVWVKKDLQQAFKYYLKAAEQGDDYAAGQVGRGYLRGDGINQDKILAQNWFEKGAAKGDQVASYHLGKLLLKKDPVKAAEFFLKAALRGHVVSYYEIAKCYHTGTGVKKNDGEALKWYERAVEEKYGPAFYPFGCLSIGSDPGRAIRCLEIAEKYGDLDACNRLGEYYLEKDEARAFDYFQRASEKGYAQASFNIGECFRLGLAGQTKDYVEALKAYNKAKDGGHIPALHAIGTLYETGGPGLMKMASKAIKWYQAAADNDPPYLPSCYALGNLYLHGNGVDADPKKAEKWFRKGAERNYPPACTALGRLYHLGVGIKQDFQQAYVWYEKSGDPLAINYIGMLYQAGEGVHVSVQEAFSRFKKAAHLRCGNACYNLAKIYDEGAKNIQSSLQEAVHWYTQAIELEEPLAYARLGFFYVMAWGGLTKNEEEAARLYHLGALNGDPGGCYHLAKFLEQGRGGIPRNEVDAILWYQKAAEKGHKDASIRLKDILLRRQKLIDLHADALEKVPQSCYELALIYQEGSEGFSKNDQEALRLFLIAADQDHEQSCYQVGLIYSQGQGVDKDPVKGKLYIDKAAAFGKKYYDQINSWSYDYSFDIETLKKAANLGYIPAYSRLGMAYELVKKDKDEAAKWYKKGIDNDDAESMYRYGDLLGSHLPEGMDCIRQAVKKGHAQACSDLGRWYETGYEVDKNIGAALFLYKKVIECGGNADYYLKKFYKENKGQLVTLYDPINNKDMGTFRIPN